jgi:hypothetical protein
MFSLSCPFQVQCLRKFVVTSCYITFFLVKYVNLLYCTSLDQGLNLVHVYALFGSHYTGYNIHILYHKLII